MSSNEKELIGNYEVTKKGLLTRREILTMGALAAGGLMSGSPALAVKGKKATKQPYVAKDFSKICNSMNGNGFSTNQIKEHIDIYQDYVVQSNLMHDQLSKVDISNTDLSSSDVRNLLTEQSYAVNGVVYHELYFGNLGGRGGEPVGELKAGVEERWGSTGKLMDFLKTAGQSVMGWVIIGYNTRGGYIDAFALDLHKVSVFSPANMVPLLVMDVYEHAYTLDFGADRQKYLSAFLDNVNWKVAEKRLSIAKQHLAQIDAIV